MSSGAVATVLMSALNVAREKYNGARCIEDLVEAVEDLVECIDNVEGDKCDKCAPFREYSFDVLTSTDSDFLFMDFINDTHGGARESLRRVCERLLGKEIVYADESM